MNSATSRAVSGSSPRPRRKPGENRAVLLAAGTVEFGLRGFTAAQTSAIAKRAGISQPNVYANFASKQELFLACLGTVAAASYPANGSSPSESSPHSASSNVSPGLATPSLTDGAESPLSDAQSLLVFQAVACAADEGSLGKSVRVIISEIREKHGDDTFDSILRHAASLLLKP